MGMASRLAVLAVGALTLGGPALAQNAGFPSRPVTIILPAGPGATADLIARAIATPLRARLGQSVIVEPKPGGGGSVASEFTARAAPDGHTIYLAGSSIVAGPIFLKANQADPIKDFAPILRFTYASYVMSTAKDLGVKTLPEFIALAKKNPRKLNYGVVPNSPMQLDLMNLMVVTGIDVVEIPFQGAAPIVQALLAQDIQLAFTAYSSVANHAREGKVVPLAVTGRTRSALAPHLPTYKEVTGNDIEVGFWYGFVAPGKTPQPIVDRLHKDLAASIREPEVQKLLKASGFDSVQSSPSEMAATMAREAKLYTEVAKKAGIKAQ